MNSITGVAQVFYVLFRNKHLRNIIWWLLLLFVNFEMLFNFVFRTFQKHAFCETLFDGCSHYVLIVKFQMLRKPLNNRSSRPEVFCKKSALKNFEKMTGKHLRQSFFSDRVSFNDCNFIKNRLHKNFSCKICKIYFIEHLRWN